MQLPEHKTYRDSLHNILLQVDLDFLRNKTIIVTGSSGMLGSCLVDLLMLWNDRQDAPCQVIAASRNAMRAESRFSAYWERSDFSFWQQDVSMPLNGGPENVDYIIHAASNADPVQMAKYPLDTLLANVQGTNLLMEYGLAHGLRRFLYVSSGEVYGQPDENDSDFIESYCGPLDLSDPRSCYPEGKRAAEVLCQSYIRQRGADIVILRPCHLFGPTMSPNDSRAAAEFLWQATAGQNIVLKSAGLLERSHCYVTDAVSALLHVLRDGLCGEVYNVAAPKCQVTIRAFAEQAARYGGCRTIYTQPTQLEAQGYSKVSRTVLASQKLQDLGWKASYDIQQGIAETVQILSDIRKQREDQ